MNINKSMETIFEMHKSYPKYNIAFVSIGNKNQKAIVKVLKNDDLGRNILKLVSEFRRKSGKMVEWVKVDFITEMFEVDFNMIRQDLVNTRRNYVDYGISLDDTWKYAFISEEINANAFVIPSKEKNTFILSEKNINTYLNKYKRIKKKYTHKQYEGKKVIKFYTKGYFIEDTNVYALDERGYTKGLRKVSDLSLEIDTLIQKSTCFLSGEISDNGKYNYGYFPHFDKRIGFYNNLRHSSATYSIIEGLSYIGEDISIAEKPIDFLLVNYLYEIDGTAHIFDDTNDINEIKLGQNATFVLAICEYLKHNPSAKKYLDAAQKVARGIKTMIGENANTIHILNYPDLTVKQEYRVIYYDGEAALALLRLYQIDGNEEWLNTVKSLFNRFIEHNYWNYHDHWLGYCTNELIQIEPKEEYYKFGIQNVSGYLDYILERETTFPTFLEMLMATYHLIEKAKLTGYGYLIDEYLDEDKFIKTIHARADFQRTGYFYPEIAMYFKKPSKIANSFFIKHHGYRVRIDDVEHYLSGYIKYQEIFK